MNTVISYRAAHSFIGHALRTPNGTSPARQWLGFALRQVMLAVLLALFLLTFGSPPAHAGSVMGLPIIVPDLRAFDMPLAFGANENRTAREISTASAALSTLRKTLGRWQISWTDTAAIPQRSSLVMAAIGTVCCLALGWAFRGSFMAWACDRTDGFKKDAQASPAMRAATH